METSSNKSKETNKNLVSSIKGKLEALSSLKSIFKVPEKLRGTNQLEKIYIPDKVSIGSFHHGKNNLKSMENSKWHYLYTLLSRKPNLEATLYECVKALRELEQTARNCYAEPLPPSVTSNEFVEMMLVDGCFIIELFFKYAVKGLRRRGDPIFTIPGLLFDIRCNLVLLENQIPLIILQSLFEIVPIPIQCTQTLGELAFRFFRNMLPGEQYFLGEQFSQEGNHLLDLIRQCYLPTVTRVLSKDGAIFSEHDHDSATKLHRKDGIKFLKFTAKSLLDIRFDDGVFEIPPLQTHQFTEVLFANLIALEQYDIDSDDYVRVQHFTSYALLMRSFIQCTSDVKLFSHLRIITNDEGKEEDSLDLFRRLCEKVDVKGYYYAGLVEQVKDYKTRRRTWRQTLKCSCLN